jgi:hypothetical protein
MDLLYQLLALKIQSLNKKIQNDVLLVPDLTKNLLSVSYLTKQFHMNYKFSYINFCVKEWETEQPLITGQYKGDFFMSCTTC